jgi:hypothetical protein
MNLHDLDGFTLAYIECALWSSTDDDGQPMDDAYDASDLHPDALAQMVEDCKSFQETESEDLASGTARAEQQGHDFWLTRNRHGAGFWDRSPDMYPNGAAERLTECAHAYGAADLYIGDDGQVHHA